MRILHINTGTSGGAALCAQRISKALQSKGVNSRMLVAQGESQEGVIVAERDHNQDFWYSNPLLGKMKHLLMRTPRYWDKEKFDTILNEKNKQLKEPLYLHGPYSNYKNIARHPLIDWADIVHLHWVPEFVDYPSFFRQVKKPIVWTLHDKFPATGIQHYNSEFFPVPNILKDVDIVCRKIKRKGVLKAKQLQLVAISEQMVNLCQNSEVLKGIPVTLIHNGVDTSVFRPYSKSEVRKILGLPANAVVFLFSSSNIYDSNKGLDRVIEAFEKVMLSNMVLVCIGINNPERSVHQSKFPIVLTGLQNNQADIAQYYSAADFFIQGSYEESFGQTILEAMSCGTPVISTPTGISPELMNTNNGILCRGYDSDALVSGIKEALNKQYDSELIRQHIIDNYSYDIIAKQYIKLYDSLL